MSRPFKIHELLDREELDALEAFASEPGITIEKVQTWLGARGYVVSRGAVHRWKQQFDTRASWDASSDLARTVMTAATKENAVAMSEAAALHMSQAIFEQSIKLQTNGSASPAELRRLSSALQHVVSSKRMLQDVADRQKRAVEEAERLANRGASGTEVVNKVRDILGLGGIRQEDIDAVRKAMFG